MMEITFVNLRGLLLDSGLSILSGNRMDGLKSCWLFLAMVIRPGTNFWSNPEYLVLPESFRRHLARTCFDTSKMYGCVCDLDGNFQVLEIDTRQVYPVLVDSDRKPILGPWYARFSLERIQSRVDRGESNEIPFLESLPDSLVKREMEAVYAMLTMSQGLQFEPTQT